MTHERLEEIAAAWATFIGKKWFWRINKRAKRVSLEDNRGNIVVDFIRYGMGSAKPRFNDNGLMRDADNYAKVVPGREHHSDWFQTIDNEVANAIAVAPEHVAELIDEVERLRIFAEDITWMFSRCTVLNSVIDPLIVVRDREEYRDGARASAARLIPYLEEIERNRTEQDSSKCYPVESTPAPPEVVERIRKTMQDGGLI